MNEQLDVGAMLDRFRTRAEAVKNRPLPPVAGKERERFLEQAQTDFLDYALIGDAQWEFVDGTLVLRIALGNDATE
ncbi:MAG: hypothetical protein ACOYN3_04630 [Acidimicrobiia bacterium]